MAAPLRGLIALLALAAACDRVPDHEPVTGGNPRHGKELIRQVGCGSCHTIPGIPGANATIAPSLDDIAKRTYLAGRLENNPEHMMKWIRNPREVDPKTAMPELGLNDVQARDIAAYLYSR